MTQKELIEFLKNNLKIKISNDNRYCDNGTYVTVSLMLGDEIISEATDFVFS